MVEIVNQFGILFVCFLFFCRTLGPMAAVEFVQCELWRGGEGASARVPAAVGCWRDAVYWHSEGTVHLLSGGLCRLEPTFVSFFPSVLYLPNVLYILTFSISAPSRPQ